MRLKHDTFNFIELIWDKNIQRLMKWICLTSQLLNRITVLLVIKDLKVIRQYIDLINSSPIQMKSNRPNNISKRQLSLS